MLCRWCRLRIYYTGVLYRLSTGSHTYLCYGGSPDHMHHP
jgi:hypothetical protein